MTPPIDVKFARYQRACEKLHARSGYIVINASGNGDIIVVRRNNNNLLEAWLVTLYDRMRAVRRARGLDSDSDEEEDADEIDIAAGAIPPYPEVVFEDTREAVLATSSAAKMASFIVGQRDFMCDLCCCTRKGEPAHYDGTGAAICWDCLGQVPTASDGDGCIICHLSGGPPTTGRLVLQCDACQKFTCRSCYCKQPIASKPNSRASKACAHCNKITLCVVAAPEVKLNTSWHLYGM